MQSNEDASSGSQHTLCSVVSASVHENLGGTAATVACYVFVEVRLPWSGNALDSRGVPVGLKERLKQLAERGHAFKTLVFTSETAASPIGSHRVIAYRNPEPPLASYERQEAVLPADRVGDWIDAYLAGDGLEAFQPYALQSDSGVRDLFVCTHGSHDACCGKFGYGAYRELERLAGESAGQLRAWRVSHIGGHRFAPTAIDLPENRYWGRLTEEALAALVHRREPAADWLRFVRGWGAVGAAEQMVEREAFAREGWAWTALRRSAETERLEDGAQRVRLYAHSADGAVAGGYTAVVRRTADIEVYGCEYDAPRPYPQYAVEALQKLE